MLFCCSVSANVVKASSSGACFAAGAGRGTHRLPKRQFRPAEKESLFFSSPQTVLSGGTNGGKSGSAFACGANDVLPERRAGVLILAGFHDDGGSSQELEKTVSNQQRKSCIFCLAVFKEVEVKMGEATTSLRSGTLAGVLSHLEKLEVRAHKTGLKQGGKREHQENVARLKVRIQELKCQRDELKTKLNVCRSLLVGDKGTARRGSQMFQATEARREALLEWKIETLKGLQQVFHLAGLSGKLTKQGACLCISTAFEGTYLGSYYLDLLLQPPVRIQRHSIPAFIPLEQIAHENLQADLTGFLSLLSEHLNAFAGRKFQADRLQDCFAAFLEGPLQGNSLYNMLEFSYSSEGGGETFPFTARLTYGDLVRTLPTEVTVTCKEDAPASEMDMAAVHLALFREKPLHEVFSSITDTAENLSQAVSLESPVPTPAVSSG